MRRFDNWINARNVPGDMGQAILIAFLRHILIIGIVIAGAVFILLYV